MSEEQQSLGKHAAPDDDPNSDPAPVAGDGGEHLADTDTNDTDTDTDTDTDDADTDGDADGDDDDEGESTGTRQPGADPEDEAEIEEEREKRLDPENRPDNVEVDNTQRDFDVERGMFTDSEGYDEAEPKFPGLGEQGA